MLLPQYDEPAPRASFRLGPGGTQDSGGDPRAGPLPPPGPAPQSLELPLPRLAPEYLSPEEMVRWGVQGGLGGLGSLGGDLG